MVKVFTIMIINLIFFNVELQGQNPGDCPTTATVITECGFAYTANNALFTSDCGGDMCGCVGGGSNPSNFDNSCTSVYAGGNCGSDFAGSVENSMWWTFTPTEDCDYIISVTPYNCCCASGPPAPDYMQVWIGQMSSGIVTSYLVNDNNNTSLTGGNTITYTVPISVADGDVFIMLDGNSGSECDVDIEINPSLSCTENCPVLLNSNIIDFNGGQVGAVNQINLNIVADGEYNWELQKSLDGVSWSVIGMKTSINNANLLWFDKSAGYTYYRINDGTNYSKTIVIWNSTNESNIVLKRYTMVGVLISDFETYNGMYIEVYKDGSKQILQK